MIILTITRRFVILISSGMLLLIAAAVLRLSLTVFIIYNMVCFAVLIIDYYLSNNEAMLEIERNGDDKLSLYEQEQIGFLVYNKNDFPIYVELKDEIPEYHFKAEKPLMKGIVKAHEKKLFSYHVMPTKRGAFSFGSLHVRYQGKLKLCMRMFQVKLEHEYKIYPNLKNLRKYRLGICNNRMYKQGQKNLKLLGRGSSFESLKEYMRGDEYRKINWNATARANKPVVNQYEPEKNQHVHLLIDTGRPMSFTVRGYRKLDMVVNTALVLSDVVNRNGDLSALMHFNTGVGNMILPGKGAGHRKQMLEALYHIGHTNLTSNFDEAFFYLKKKERHRSIIFLFTDFETREEAEELLRVLPVISRNNIVIVPLMRNESQYELMTAEATNQDELFNKGVAFELLEERKRIIQLLNRRGVMCFECVAEKLEFSTINKYIQVKNQAYL